MAFVSAVFLVSFLLVLLVLLIVACFLACFLLLAALVVESDSFVRTPYSGQTPRAVPVATVKAVPV